MAVTGQEHEIEPVLAQRWSPRAFEARPVEREKLMRLFEAARWAASSFNEQPWRFFVARHDEEGADYEKLASCLVEFNRNWAAEAPVLILTATKTTFSRNGKPNRVHQHDLGLAMGNLCAQATAMGLHVRQMAGIDPEKARELLGLPEDVQAQTACALGYAGEPEQLPESLREEEESERERLGFEQFVFAGSYGQAWGDR